MREHFEKLLSGKTFQILSDLVYQHSRIRLGPDKQSLMANRLRKRLSILNLESYEDYCDVLHSPHGSDEVEEMVDLISTNHTRFYREPEHFSFLTQQALPALVQPLRAACTPLRLWSAAASSGEEPYTMAIAVADFLRSHPGLEWEIVATDISRRMLTVAHEGIYSMDSVRPVPLEQLKRYFKKGVGVRTGVCQVKLELRKHLHFERVNLFQPHLPVPANQHVIFCRNVMIYFDLPSRALAVKRLAQHLAPGGYLMVGHSESLMGINHGLYPVQQGVFQKT
jgi:chemotaxis protein methyltransferase CheR